MKLYGRYSVIVSGDEKHIWEPDEVTLSEQLMLENEAECSYEEWISGAHSIRAGYAEACQILVWFLRRKAGQQMDRFAVDFPIRRLDIEQIEEPVALPEVPAGSEQSEPATSSPSPSTESGPSSGGLSLAKTS